MTVFGSQHCRFVGGTLFVIWVTLAGSCAAADLSGADCLNSGIARLGATNASKLTVTCDAPELVKVIGMPPSGREPLEAPSDTVPREIGALIRDARANGYNWCALRNDELGSLKGGQLPDTLHWECRQVLGVFEQFITATGSSFQIALSRTANGGVNIVGVTARERRTKP